MGILDGIKPSGNDQPSASFLDRWDQNLAEKEAQYKQRKKKELERSKIQQPPKTQPTQQTSDFATLEAKSVQGVPKPTPLTSLPPGVSSTFAQEHPDFTNFMNTVTSPIRNFLNDTSIGKGITRLGREAGGLATSGASELGRGPLPSTGNPTVDKVIDFASIIPGIAANPGGGSIGEMMSAAGKGSKFAFDTLTKGLQPASKIGQAGLKAGQKFAEGTGAGIPFSTYENLGSNKPMGERLKDIAKESALFGAIDVGALGAGKAIQQTPLYKNWQLSKAIDNLTPANKPLASSLNGRSAFVNEAKPIIQTTQETTFKPNQGPLSKGKFMVSTPTIRQWDQLIEEAKKRGPLPPGREYETLQGIWSEIAPPNAGSLNDLIGRIKNVSTEDLLNAGINKLKQNKDAQKYGIYHPFKVGEKTTKQVTKEINPFPTFQNTGNLKTGSLNIQLPKKTKPDLKALGQMLPKQEVAATKPLDETLLPKHSPEASGLPTLNEKKRGFINTLENSPKSTEPFLQRLDSTYTPITNEETVKKANRRVSNNIDEAASFVLSADKATPENIATAHRLIDEFQKAGNYERAVDIAEKIAELGTKAGQSIQAFSIYNRLSPEGVLIHATRIANKVNERLRPGQKPVEVTKEIASQLNDLASTVQTMTGTKDVSNNVISIMEKAKTGARLDSEEMKQIQQFANDVKKFIGEQTPKARKPRKAPSIPKEPIVRKQVISFLEQQEKAARERIAARRGRLNSLPVDELADYAIIGATKMTKGVVKFSIWSEQMAKEFGETIRPYLAEIYDKAVEAIENQTNVVKRTKLSEVEKIANKALKNAQLDPADAENLRQMAIEITKLSGEQKAEAAQELQAALQELDRPTLLQKVSSFQTQAQLLNPKTILTRNPLGNELFYHLERINKYVSTPIDWTRSKITGGERTVTFKKAGQTGYWKGFLQGIKAGWKGVNVNGLETQFDLRGPAFKGKWNPLTYTEKALGSALRGFDNAAYQRAVNQTMGELATLRAINEGLQGKAKKEAIERYIRQMDENGLAIAHEYGKYITFQDNNILSLKLQSLKRGLNSINEFVGIHDKSWGLGDILLKYPRTPGALVMRALDYSPTGFLRSLYLISEPLIRKDVERNTREATQSVARAITGSMGITGLGWFLADVGILTGNAADDQDIRELQKSTGAGQFKLNITALKRFVLNGWDRKKALPQNGDTFISYDWAQPVAISLSAGANISQNIKQNKDPLDNTGNTILNSVLGGLSTIVEQPVLQGITKPFRGYNAADSFTQTAQDIPASFMPTFLNQIRQLDDNTYRSTYDPDGINETLNKLKNKVPGIEKSLPKSFDTLGRKKEVFQNGSNNAFNVFLNPAFVSKYQPTNEEQMLIDLYNRTGNKNIAPRVPDKYLIEKGKKINLTPEQYSQLQKEIGVQTLKRLQQVNQNLSDEQKIKKLINLLNEAGKAGRNQIKKEYNIK